MGLIPSFIGLLLFSISSPAFAKTVQLFDCAPARPTPIADYQRRLLEVMPGDRLLFCTGEIFKIEKTLGHGQTSMIFEIAEPRDQILRLNLTPNNIRDMNGKMSNAVDQIYDGDYILERGAVKKVRILKYAENQYALMEKIPGKFLSAEIILSKQFAPGSVPYERLLDELVEFSKTTARFESIGDFNFENLIYDFERGEWLLMDWTSRGFSRELQHRVYRPRPQGETRTAFDHAFGVFESDYVVNRFDESKRRSAMNEIQSRIRAAIAEERIRPTYALKKTKPACRVPNILSRLFLN